MGGPPGGTVRALLRQTADHAADFYEALDERRVSVTVGVRELREVLGRPLPDGPMDASQVIAELVRDTEAGLLGSAGGRFFGWVIGGSVPAALAADWLTSAWDQNAAPYACAPAEAVAEEICGVWLKDLLGLPAHASFALVTGTQMGHATALAAARNKLLAERGGLAGRRRSGLSPQGASTPRSTARYGCSAWAPTRSSAPGPTRRAASTSEGFTASYLIRAAETGGGAAPRDQIDYNPEWSRRGRGFAVYAAIRSLGRSGIAQIIDDCCDHARRLTAGIGALPSAEVLCEPQINQGLVRFTDPGGDHDGRTDRLIARIQQDGRAWFGATTFNGIRAMRISVVNHRTTGRDIEQATAAVRDALSRT